MSEIWKPAPGFEDRYEVSNQGRVRSIDRRVRLVAHGKETTRFAKGQLLRAGTCRSGHLSVALGKGNSRMVHQLVLEAFVGPRPAGQEVLHLNHNPKDNRLSNLKYGTRSENIRMDYEAGKRRVHPNFIGARWRK
ncbi:NUMOD4 motif-containing HNH endonuclease [Salmonella enterica]|nr:NUMOD4 motif-containing HNH endonuclease [Salmonella enterica]